jgi:integrin alpha FG-GAP repeat containing protein 1
MSPLTAPPSALAQPMPVDTHGDMKMDLLGMTPSSNANWNKPLMLWQNVWNASDPDSSMFEL